MSRFCPNCGYELGENVKFCQSCGTNVEALTNPNVSTPEEEQHPADEAQPVAAPAPTSPIPSADAPQPAGPIFAPTGSSSLAAPPKNNLGKIIAGIVALVMLGAGGYAATKMLSDDDASATELPAPGEQGPASEGPPAEEPSPGSESPPEGDAPEIDTSTGLETIILESVGPYSLLETGSNAQFTSDMSASEGVSARYSGPAGEEIIHNVLRYGTDAQALSAMDSLAGALEGQGYAILDARFDIVSSESNVIGLGYLLEDADTQVYLWTNAGLLSTAEGPIGSAQRFYEESEY